MNSFNYSLDRSLSIFTKDESSISCSIRQDRFIPSRHCEESDLTNYDTPERKKKKPQQKKSGLSPLKSIPIITSESPESSNKKKYAKMLKKTFWGKRQIKWDLFYPLTLLPKSRHFPTLTIFAK